MRSHPGDSVFGGQEDPSLSELVVPNPQEGFVGYVSSGGSCYRCGGYEHRFLAEVICDELDIPFRGNAQDAIEEKGYIRVSTPGAYDNGVSWDTGRHVPTKKQIDVLLSIGRFDSEVEEDIEFSEMSALVRKEREKIENA